MYTPQIYQLQDKNGRSHDVPVVKDSDTDTYVAEIRSRRLLRMADGSERGEVIATGEADNPLAAAKAAVKDLAALHDRIRHKTWTAEELTAHYTQGAPLP